MLLILDNVINVDIQDVNYVYIYLSVRIFFSKLFNSVFVSSCLLGVLFSFMLMILDNVGCAMAEGTTQASQAMAWLIIWLLLGALSINSTRTIKTIQ